MHNACFDFLLAWHPSKEAVEIFHQQMKISAEAWDNMLKERKPKQWETLDFPEVKSCPAP